MREGRRMATPSMLEIDEVRRKWLAAVGGALRPHLSPPASLTSGGERNMTTKAHHGLLSWGGKLKWKKAEAWIR